MKIKTQLVIVAVFALVFIAIVLYEVFRPPKYTALDFHQGVSLTVIEQPAMRGAVSINDTLVIGSSILLIDNESTTYSCGDTSAVCFPQSEEYKKKIPSTLGDLAPPIRFTRKRTMIQ